MLCSTSTPSSIFELTTKGEEFWKRLPNALRIFLSDEDVLELPSKVTVFFAGNFVVDLGGNLRGTLTACFLTQVNIFKSCAIGRSSDGAPETWTAFANSSHYDKPKYSTVSLVGSAHGEDQIWYGKVVGFLSFSCPTRHQGCKG